MKKRYIIPLAVLVQYSTLTYAAQPKSVKYVEDLKTENNEPFAHYIVKCNNGATVDVSAWDDNKLWCLAKGEKATCKKKQIKIAKKACKGV